MIGLSAPVISEPSPNTTSVIVHWTQPRLSFPAVNYAVSIMGTNTSFTEIIKGAVRTFKFTNLKESTDYTITVTANIKAFGQSFNPTSSKKVTTLKSLITNVATTISTNTTGKNISIVKKSMLCIIQAAKVLKHDCLQNDCIIIIIMSNYVTHIIPAIPTIVTFMNSIQVEDCSCWPLLPWR